MLAAGSAVVVCLVYAFQFLYPSEIGGMSEGLTVLAAGCALVVALFTLRKYWTGGRGPFSLVWVGVSAGILLWFLGYVTWGYYISVLGVPVPYPSAADGFFLSGYLPVILALAQYVRIFKGALSRKRAAAIGGAIFVAAFLVSWVIIAPVLTESVAPLEKLFDFAYPLLDLAMLSLAIFGLSVFLGGTIAKSWLLLLVAVYLVVGADLLFDYMTAEGIYYNGSVVDLLYVLSYITVALALYVHGREL